MYRGFRLPDELDKQLRAVSAAHGFKSPSHFVRAALRDAVAGKAGSMATSEERIRTELEKNSLEVRRVSVQMATVLAYTSTLAEAVLTYVPEPKDMSIAKSRAQIRYRHFLREAAHRIRSAPKETVCEGDF